MSSARKDTRPRFSLTKIISLLRVFSNFEKPSLHEKAECVHWSSKSSVYRSAKSPLTCQCALLKKSSSPVEYVGVFTHKHYAGTSHPFLKYRVRSEFVTVYTSMRYKRREAADFKGILA